jgi:hypothetical protein
MTHKTPLLTFCNKIPHTQIPSSPSTPLHAYIWSQARPSPAACACRHTPSIAFGNTRERHPGKCSAKGPTLSAQQHNTAPYVLMYFLERTQGALVSQRVPSQCMHNRVVSNHSWPPNTTAVLLLLCPSLVNHDHLVRQGLAGRDGGCACSTAARCGCPCWGHVLRTQHLVRSR